MPLLVGALVANGLARFVAWTVGGTAPRCREQAVTMNQAIASGRSPRSWAPTYKLLPSLAAWQRYRGASAIVFLVAIPIDRCFGRCGSARGVLGPTTPNARPTDLLRFTPWSPVGYMERAPW